MIRDIKELKGRAEALFKAPRDESRRHALGEYEAHVAEKTMRALERCVWLKKLLCSAEKTRKSRSAREPTQIELETEGVQHENHVKKNAQLTATTSAACLPSRSLVKLMLPPPIWELLSVRIAFACKPIH
jgi:hypothetical protein